MGVKVATPLIHVTLKKMFTYSEMCTNMSFPPSCGVMKPCPLLRQKLLHTPDCSGDSEAILDLKENIVVQLLGTNGGVVPKGAQGLQTQ